MSDAFDELKNWIEREFDYINKQLAPALIAQGKILCPRYHADTEIYYTNPEIYTCKVCERKFRVKDGIGTGDWHYSYLRYFG